MTLSQRIHGRRCQFCEREVTYPALVCDDCLGKRFFTKPPKGFVPEWRRRLIAKDMTRSAA